VIGVIRGNFEDMNFGAIGRANQEVRVDVELEVVDVGWNSTSSELVL